MSSIDVLDEQLVPFTDPYSKSGSGLFVLPGEPSLLFRHSQDIVDREQILGLLQHQDLLDELETQYHIPHCGAVMMYTSPRDILIVTERIDAPGLREALDRGLPGALEAADRLYGRLCCYIGAKAVSNEAYVGDIWTPDQYVFEPMQRDTILVDVDEMTGNTDLQQNPDINMELSFLYMSILRLQEQYGAGAAAYERFRELLEMVPQLGDQGGFIQGLIRKHAFRRPLSENELNATLIFD